MIVVASAFLIGGVAWLLVDPSLAAGFFAAVSATLLAVALVNLARHTAPRMRLAAPEATVVDGALRVGEEFALNYRQTWKRATDVGRVRLELLLRETVRYTTTSTTGDRSSTKTVTATHDRVAQGFFAGGQHFESGQTINEYRRFRIPEDGMHTFVAPDNRIEWYVVVVVEIDRWPDYRWEHELTVLPELLG